jgi:hypothetical protein
MNEGIKKHRYSYSGGVKAVEEQKWGRDTARSRYGSLDFDQKPPLPPKDMSEPQFKATDGRGPDWKDDTAKDWRVGFGKNGVESAEGKPNFDKSKRR